MKKINSTLLIFGDSWGRGAWTLPDETLLYETEGDNYFAEKFQEKFAMVENYSEGGASNSDTIRYLEKELKTKLAENKRVSVLVIQTEPIRSVIPQINFGSVSPFYKIFDTVDYASFNETLIDFFYFNLNEMGKRFKVQINLVGGCSDVNTRLTRKYPYIRVCCESFYGLLQEDYTPTIFSCTYNISDAIKKFNLKNNFVISSIALKQGIQSEYQRNMFGYGLDNHPSRKGIDMWVSHIYNSVR